jgi:lipoprotein-releasing system ATP-binding protein
MLIAENLHKMYRRHAVKVPVLRGVDLSVSAGEFVSVIGQSGSGKSTLLHLLGTLDRPDQGTVTWHGQRIDDLPSRPRDQLRNTTFGFIFQFYHLLPELSALDNVLMPAYIAHGPLSWLWHRATARKRAIELLEQVGLGHRLHHKPRELSGGEMQRTAIARALLNRPAVLLADEPTGNLDAASGGEIIRLLRDLNQHAGVTIIMVTHNLDLVHSTDRMIKLAGGRIEGPLRAVAC